MVDTVDINGKEVEAQQFRNDWALALMSQGVIVKLSVSRWRAKMKLTPQMLGLKFVDEDSSDFMRRYVRLGEQKLLPPEIIGEIEGVERRARSILESFSFETVWGRFIPFTAFESWERENKIIHDDFVEQAVVLGRKYNEIIGAVKKDYRNMARDVWSRLYSESQGGATESFIENFVSNIIERIPSQEEVVASFKYNTTYFIIPMPSFIEEQVARAQEIRREEQMKEFDGELERDTKRRIQDEYVQKKQELIDGFLESTVSNMRNYVSELCNKVLISLSQKSKSNDITSSTINKLKGMIRKIKLLNFYNDDQITNLLKDLEGELDKFKGERDKNIIVEKLREIVDVGVTEYVPNKFNPAVSYLEVT